MTLLERQSKRKCKALKNMVDNGDYSPSYALEKLEDYFDKGKVIESDYEPLAEYLEDLIDNPIVEEPIIIEPVEVEPEVVEEGGF